MGDIRLNLVVLRSADAGRAVEFYSRLGLCFLTHRHGDGPEHSSAELSGSVFETYPLVSGASPTTGTRVGFIVPDLEASIRALTGFSGAIISSPCDSEWGRRAVVVDPDGHKVELLQSTCAATAGVATQSETEY